jgi:hypothetical protein
MPPTTIALLAGLFTVLQATAPAPWLDQAMKNWNVAGAAVPKAPAGEEPRTSLVKRCPPSLRPSTPAERALADAGWIPFWNFDQQLVREDVEIVGGMSGADGMCRPTGYNVFVFVGGQFAGTISPVAMTSRLDGSSGAVRIGGRDLISAEFSRYTDKDALCCPSSRVSVRYRIDRSGRQPLVVPTDVRTTRGH